VDALLIVLEVFFLALVVGLFAILALGGRQF